MFSLRKPTEEEISRFISSQRELPFSYPEVGATQRGAPAGYTVDHNRIRLGDGEATYTRAVAALKNWQHFELGWVKIVPAGIEIRIESTVAVQARTFGLWSLSACRIVYLINEAGPTRRFGFAYGTLPDHVERGEERFTIEWFDDDSVWYDIYAFSRPAHPLARIGSPLTRRMQERFAKDSLAAMLAFSH